MHLKALCTRWEKSVKENVVVGVVVVECCCCCCSTSTLFTHAFIEVHTHAHLESYTRIIKQRHQGPSVRYACLLGERAIEAHDDIVKAAQKSYTDEYNHTSCYASGVGTSQCVYE